MDTTTPPHTTNTSDAAVLVPAELRRRDGCQLGAYMELLIRGADMRPVRASARSIARAIHTSHTTVLHALKRLEAAGWVRRFGSAHAPSWQVMYEPTPHA